MKVGHRLEPIFNLYLLADFVSRIQMLRYSDFATRLRSPETGGCWVFAWRMKEPAQEFGSLKISLRGSLPAKHRSLQERPVSGVAYRIWGLAFSCDILTQFGESGRLQFTGGENPTQRIKYAGKQEFPPHLDKRQLTGADGA
jgi:hypothetical protein